MQSGESIAIWGAIESVGQIAGCGVPCCREGAMSGELANQSWEKCSPTFDSSRAACVAAIDGEQGDCRGEVR